MALTQIPCLNASFKVHSGGFGSPHADAVLNSVSFFPPSSLSEWFARASALIKRWALMEEDAEKRHTSLQTASHSSFSSLLHLWVIAFMLYWDPEAINAWNFVTSCRCSNLEVINGQWIHLICPSSPSPLLGHTSIPGLPKPNPHQPMWAAGS